jgi:hypothetical protein
VETGNESYRFRHSSTAAKTKIKARELKQTSSPTESTEAEQPF